MGRVLINFTNLFCLLKSSSTSEIKRPANKHSLIKFSMFILATLTLLLCTYF